MKSRRPIYRLNRRIATNVASDGGTSELISLLTLATDAYAESAVNTIMLRGDLITSPATGDQYFAYHADNPPSILTAKLKIGKITPADAVSVDASGITTDGEDSHNYFALAVDGDDDLLISGDMHAVPMNFQRLTGGGIHMTAWMTPPIEAGATDEASVTYPIFSIPLSSGDILFFFRDGGSGQANLVLKKWKKATNTLATVQGVVVDGEAVESFYPHVPYYDEARDRVHIMGCWRVTTSLATNHDQLHFYLESSDGWDTCTAKKADGSAQTLPVTRGNAAYAAVIATNNGLANVGSITIDSDGNPRGFCFRDPGNGFSQLFALRYNGSAWVECWIPENVQLQNGIPFSYVGVVGGPNTTPFSSMRAICDGTTNRTIALVRSDTEGAGTWALICERQDLTEWVWRQLDSTAVGFWFGSEDRNKWRLSGEIHTTVQRAKFDAESTIGPQTLRRLKFRPKSASYTYTAPAALFDPDTYAGCVAYLAPRVNGVKVKGQADSATYNLVTAVMDARDQSALFTQVTESDDPHLVWNHFGTRRGGILFASLTSDYMLATDAATLAAINGTNVPLAFFAVIQFTNVTASQRFFSFGNTAGGTTHYTSAGITAAGLPVLERNVGGTVKQYLGASALVAGTKYVFTGVFDGTNGYIRINGVQQGAAVSLSFAGATSWTHLSLGCRRRSAGNDLYFDGTLGAMPLYTTVPSGASIAVIEAALAAENGITF